jgi:hypothetical protein
MRWVRSNVRFGSWCALFALAIQFIVLFGHAHRTDLAWPSGTSPLSALSTEAPSAAVPDAPSSPSKPVGLAFDYCAICAVMNLAGSVVPAAAPGLPVQVVIGRVRFWTTLDVSLAELPHLLFQARAPPLA